MGEVIHWGWRRIGRFRENVEIKKKHYKDDDGTLKTGCQNNSLKNTDIR